MHAKNIIFAIVSFLSFLFLISCKTIELQVNEITGRYGIKWSLTDYDDLGTRCFDAEGKMANIGVGIINGSSDFDNIYPWSEIKRCNIKNVDKEIQIVYEGEPSFSLDGSNGDVFVRIPKFCVDKYIKDGYVYRVISRSLGEVHPIFIEEGRELDEVFIGAFEGYIDNGILLSIGGVIPTSNVTAETFLAAAMAKGNGYSLYDMRAVDAIWNLYAVEFGSRNTNQYLGFGFSDYMQPTYCDYLTIKEAASNTNTVRVPLMTVDHKLQMPVGSNITVCDKYQSNILTQARILSVTDGMDYTEFVFDGNPITVNTDCFIGSAACTTNFSETCNLSWHTGRALYIGGKNQEMKNPVRYRWIENIIGSLWHFLPDVSFDALQMYVCDNIKDYSFYNVNSPYRPVGSILPSQTDNGQKNDMTGVNHWVTSLVSDNLNTTSIFGKMFSDNLTSRQAFGGFYYLSPNKVCVVNGGGFDHANRCNMLTNRAWHTAGTKWYLYGSRLMYKKID